MVPTKKDIQAVLILAEIQAHGYHVIYDAFGNQVASKVEASLSTLKEIQPVYLTEDEFKKLIQKLMFQLIYAGKK